MYRAGRQKNAPPILAGRWFFCFKAGLLSVTHQHQQECEHVQEVEIQV